MNGHSGAAGTACTDPPNFRAQVRVFGRPCPLCGGARSRWPRNTSRRIDFCTAVGRCRSGKSSRHYAESRPGRGMAAPPRAPARRACEGGVHLRSPSVTIRSVPRTTLPLLCR
eukprot:1243422-Prymnesium_polylepis.1